VTEFQVSSMLTCRTMDGQMHSIGKAIRSLFADPVLTLIFMAVGHVIPFVLNSSQCIVP